MNLRMEPGEVGKLLGLMAMADNRKPPDEDDEEAWNAMIAFWLTQIGDLTYDDCAQAISEHYRETREWIMPADIRRRVKAIRAKRISGSVVEPPPGELADQPGPAYFAALQQNIQRAGDGHAPPADEVPLALPPGQRAGGPPVSLAASLGELRQRLGQARHRRAIEAPEDIARRQADESRAARAADETDGTEAAS